MNIETHNEILKYAEFLFLVEIAELYLFIKGLKGLIGEFPLHQERLISTERERES